MKKHSFYNGAKGDYSIVKINTPTYTCSSNVGGIDVRKGSLKTNPVGTSVQLKAASGRNVSGVIAVTNMSTRCYVSPGQYYLIHGITYVTPDGTLSKDGDSGGAWINGDTFYGVHNGTQVFEGSDLKYLNFTPYSTLNKAGFGTLNHTHNFSCTKLNSTNHKYTCSVCGTYYLQKHTATWDYSSNCCAACGHR